MPPSAAAPARARCCSWTKSTASTAPSRTGSCRCGDRHGHADRCHHGKPSFALNGALLSRCQVRCCVASTTTRWRSCWPVPRPRWTAHCRSMPRPAPRCARWPMATVAICSTWPSSCRPARRHPMMDPTALAALLAKRAALYDKDREEHYNLISALHKSLRGSDADAALYWFARMLTGGEDPRYIARRLVRFAVRTSAWPTRRRCRNRWPVGDLRAARLAGGRAGDRPGGGLSGDGAESNAIYTAFGAARRAAKDTGSLMPPAHILNAPTKLIRSWLRCRLRLRPRNRGSILRPELFPRWHAARVAVSTARPGLRARDRQAHGLLGEAAGGAEWVSFTSWPGPSRPSTQRRCRNG